MASDFAGSAGSLDDREHLIGGNCCSVAHSNLYDPAVLRRFDLVLHFHSLDDDDTLSDTVSDTRGIGAARRWVKAEFERISAACGGCLQVFYVSDMAGPTGGIMIKSTSGATLIVNDTGIYIQIGKGASITLVGSSVAVPSSVAGSLRFRKRRKSWRKRNSIPT